MIEEPPFDFFFVSAATAAPKSKFAIRVLKTYRYIIEGRQGMLASSNGNPGGRGGRVG